MVLSYGLFIGLAIGFLIGVFVGYVVLPAIARYLAEQGSDRK